LPFQCCRRDFFLAAKGEVLPKTDQEDENVANDGPERTQGSWFLDAELDIAEICVAYLSFDVFATSFCPTFKEFEARLRANPLYDSAARNWGYHARVASLEVEQSNLDLPRSEAKVSAASQAMLVSKSSSWNHLSSAYPPRQMTGVHLAAHFWLKEAIIYLL
jgi:hypothetical protein